MSQEEVAEETVYLEVEKVGGIDHASAELAPGVTILTGRNATNRTSFLQAIMAVMGSDKATLKADSDEGAVELTIGDRTYTRRLTRHDGTLTATGDPYLDDPALADLFAFLLETNEARQAVARGSDLRELIMRAVDTEAIEAEIDRLEAERDELTDELEELDSLKRRLPELEEERQRLQQQIEGKRGDLEAKNDEIEDLDADIEETREGKAELEEKLDELSDVRGELEDVRHRIGSERESIEALEDERDELEVEFEDYSGIPEDRIAELDEEVQRLRGQVQSVDTTVDQLASIIQFNQDCLDDGHSGIVDRVLGEADEGAVTEQLLADEEVVCWTCGSQVDAGQIETTLDQLRDLHAQKMETRQEFRSRIDELEDERIQLEEKRRQHDQLEEDIQRIEREIDDRRDRLAELTERREELSGRVATLEEDVEASRTEEYGEVLDVHKEANELEFELDRLQDDLADVEDEIARTEARLDEREQLEAQIDEVRGELEELRTRVERLEQEAIEAFNHHMEAVLDLLDYENLERIWIERVEESVRSGRRTVSKGRFDLHVVRSTESGAVYEDTVDHLSESEREVTGLVFALAGYLVHDVHETVPFMLLDSVEALDSDRISDLVDYLQGFADHLVVALLPEDSVALDDDYQRITEL